MIPRSLNILLNEITVTKCIDETNHMKLHLYSLILRWSSRTESSSVLKMLERSAVKAARYVLRGACHSNVTGLLGDKSELQGFFSRINRGGR
jgi:hypothetical protein